MPEIMPPKLMQGVINPFSETFLDSWQLWKDYRWEEHKFKYKGVRSEQAALMWINDESGQNEEEAVRLIKRSIANGWKGFFKEKSKINNNGTSQAGFTRKSVSEEFNSRPYGKREP